MKAVVYERHGGPEELRVREVADPEPGPGEAVVRVRAAGLNGFDPMMLAGSTGLKVPFPMTPCGDAAGEVVAFGPDTETSALAEGDRVMLDPSIPGRGMFGETIPGTCRELIAAPASALVPIPDGVGFSAAASIPVAYGTALRMMEERGRVAGGEKVLVLGATGGVGCCCVQLAKRVGAEVMATGRGEWKLERLRELGADHVVDTASQDFVELVRETWGKPRYKRPGGGAAVIVNYIGGDTWARSLKVLAEGGRMLTCGATAGYDPPTDIRYIWSFEQTIIGSDGWTREGLERLLVMAADRSLVPVVHAERSMEDAHVAMRELIDRDVFGKSILLP
ncbi:MAG: zinc-binding dehydrogenase [Gemmatimonadetes bacterium]|nr:zinc-binding dehydrogenase [Gemmatimonadota bacterium]